MLPFMVLAVFCWACTFPFTGMISIRWNHSGFPGISLSRSFVTWDASLVAGRFISAPAMMMIYMVNRPEVPKYVLWCVHIHPVFAYSSRCTCGFAVSASVYLISEHW
jgi:hypothetical protein